MGWREQSIVLTYYALAICLGVWCRRPRLAFYIALVAGLAVCVILFRLKVYLEMGGLLHTLPFAWITWWIAHRRRSPKAH